MKALLSNQYEADRVPVKDVFFGSKNDRVVQFGMSMTSNPKSEYQRDEYLYQPDLEPAYRDEVGYQGSDNARFGLGFYRKRMDTSPSLHVPSNGLMMRSLMTGSEPLEAELEPLDVRERKEKMREARKAALTLKNASNRNIVTGSNVVEYREPSKKMNKEPLSNYQQREIKVRQKTDPDTRYYTFFPKGDTYDQRRQLKAREGLSSFQSKRSSLLGTGRGDLPSYGVEDNFGKSVYLEQESQRHHTATSSIFDSTLSVVQGRSKQDRARSERNEEVESVRNLP
jgi:hypothetical protein